MGCRGVGTSVGDDRLRTRRALERERDWHWQMLFDGMHVGIIRVGSSGLVEVINRTAEVMLGIRAGDLIGRPLETLNPRVSVPDLGILIRANYLVDWEMRAGDRLVRVKKTTFLDSYARFGGQLITLSSPDGSRCLSGFSRIPTNVVISELASVVAHEVRNPLAAIRGFAQLAREKLLSAGGDDHVSGFLEVMIGEADRLNNIVTQFAVLADSGPLCRSEVDMNGLVRNTWESLNNEFGHQGVEARCELDVGLPPIQGDEDLLRQAFEHLGRNGAQAAGPGGQVNFRTVRSESGVALEVADTGPGISGEIKDRIFLPFFSTYNGQTGLGLAICKHIVQRHGGQITVQNGVKGAVFTVFLPAS